ncbi:GNAT family N-acetyltransferase [Rufibacter psychrotolerans]|uniref:GNAT family N-acetyltransferase n=1 Tax=Rufibacter psychrotolerans TaxID=2812556 RepID=UPI0019683A9E|nr:GNAT family N-acetyltransferase [Rufibacter sp. SYSU D00308]
MIKLLRHQEISPERWEACLARAHQPLVYVHAWYLDVVCGGAWEALVELQGEEYVSLFPLPVRSLLGQKRVYQPLFTQQLGLVVTPQSKETDPNAYLALLPGLFGQVQYQLPNVREITLGAPWNHRLRPNYELSLEPGYPALEQHYSTNLRRNLKKAAKTPLEVQVVSSIEPLVSLFRSTKGQELTELKPRHYQTLEQLYQRAAQRGVGQVWEVRRQNKLLCGAFLLCTPHRVTFLFGASSEEGRAASAMAFLLDHLLQREAGSGKTFDFEGSEVPGVANFYAGFGAQPVPYVSLSTQPKRFFPAWIITAFISLAKRLR